MKNEFIALFQKIGEVQRYLLWEKTKESGLSPIQIQLLLYIKNCEDQRSNVSQIASFFNLKAPTISESIKTLRKKGLVEQIRCLTDRRIHCYQLSETGHAITKEISSWTNPLESVFEKMSETDKICIVKNLYKIVYYLSEAALCCGLQFCLSCSFFKNEEMPTCKLLGKTFDDGLYVLNCPHYECKKSKPNTLTKEAL